MDTSTKWHCEHCGHDGNLSTLIQLHQEQIRPSPGTEIYNPVIEHRNIKKTFRRLIQSSEDDALSDRLKSLFDKTEKLIIYVQQKNRKATH